MHVLTADYRANNAKEVFVESLRNTGFAVVSHHPISAKLVDDTYSEWRDFFSSPDKQTYLFTVETQDGYFPFRSENAKYTDVKDLKEFYHYYPWGKFPVNLSNKTETLYNDMSALASTLLSWIEELTPVNIKSQFSMPLTEMIKASPRTLLRILNYPPLIGDEKPGEVRAAAHEDINLITLLPAATTTGLEVLDVKGNWHKVPCDHGTIVVNVGDMLEMCSNHYYKSTTHQVVNPEGPAAKEQRLSMPLFLHPNDDVRLSDTHTAKSYLFERMKELGLK